VSSFSINVEPPSPYTAACDSIGDPKEIKVKHLARARLPSRPVGGDQLAEDVRDGSEFLVQLGDTLKHPAPIEDVIQVRDLRAFSKPQLASKSVLRSNFDSVP
jgi:hypothetical protein